MGKKFLIGIDFDYLNILQFRLNEDSEHAAFDEASASVIRLNNSTVLYMKEVNKVLALVCILREENFTQGQKNRIFNNCIEFYFY